MGKIGNLANGLDFIFAIASTPKIVDFLVQ